MKKTIFLVASYLVVFLIGFGAGIYLLPILTAPPGPATSDVRAAAEDSTHSGQFRRDLQDSDAFHWGEGTVFVGQQTISLEGSVSPGPDYKLYLSPEYVETEAAFIRLKPNMVYIGDIKSFENFIIPVPASVDPLAFNTIVVWCETFSQFITAAEYR